MTDKPFVKIENFALLFFSPILNSTTDVFKRKMPLGLNSVSNRLDMVVMLAICLNTSHYYLLLFLKEWIPDRNGISMVVVELALFYSNTANLVRLGEVICNAIRYKYWLCSKKKCMKYTKTSSHKQADYNPSGNHKVWMICHTQVNYSSEKN